MGWQALGWRWAAASVLLSGCAWIGAGERAERLGKLDEDGDGVQAADEVQCGENGDRSPNKFPGNPEVPYDGIDNDCQGGDLVDKDGDGFPGVTEEQYLTTLVSVDPIEAEVWPADAFEGRGLDCLDEPGPGSSVNPGVVNDSAYDGIDADCGRDNEFDIDGDGFIKLGTDAGYQAYLDNFNYDFGAVAFGDCDDDDATVFPFHSGNPPERGFSNASFDDWYDGKDADCGGNNDFDADGDGYYPALYEAPFQEYSAAFGGGTVSVNDLAGDCWDSCDAAVADSPDTDLPDTDGDGRVDFCQPPNGFPYPTPVDASEVNEGVGVNLPYDAVDADCNGDNDFDQDRDEYTTDTASLEQVTQFLGWWGGDTLDVSSGDCNDDDPDVYPGKQEVLDGQDQDCFGSANSDTAAFRIYEGSGWTNLGQVEVARTDIHWALSVPADHVVWPLGSVNGASTNMFLMYDLQAGAIDPTIRAALISHDRVFPGNDLVADGESLHVAMTYATLEETVSEWVFTWNNLVPPSYDLVDYDVILFDLGFNEAQDVSVLVQPNGDSWTVGCGDGVVYGVENLAAGNGRTHVSPGLANAEACLTEDDGTGNPRFVVCSTLDCAAYEFETPYDAVIPSPLVPTTVPAEWSVGGWKRIERYGDAIAVVPPTGNGMEVWAATDQTYFSGDVVLSASAATFGGDQTVVVAVVADTPTNSVKLIWDNGAVQTETELGFIDPAFNPQDVSLGISGTEILVAATADGADSAGCEVACPDDDQVGWLLLNLQ